ncbi:vWA domain-containing protein [Halobacteriales archaeon Cl-PHB]
MYGGDSAPAERGVSDIFGVVLLVSLTLVGALAVVAVGGMALQAIADQTQSDVAHQSMQEMSSRLSGLADSSVDDSTTFTFPEGVGNDVTLNGSDARFQLAVTNRSLAAAASPPACSVSANLGTVYYTKDEGGVYAYQGGGVWERGDGASRMVAPPQLDYDGGTIDFSLVNVSRLDTINENTKVVASKDVEASRKAVRSLEREFRPCWTNITGQTPVEVNATLTIESEFADSWATYANQSMRVSPDRVRYWESNETVKMVFYGVGQTAPSNASNGGGGGNASTGGNVDDALEEESNALRVYQTSGSLELLSAQIGAPVEKEVVVEEAEYRDPMDVMFVIDETGSMAYNDPGEERLEQTENFIDELNASHGDRVGYVQFHLERFFDDGIHDWHGMTGSNFQSVKDSLADYSTGGTEISRGIEFGLERYLDSPSNNDRVMIVLSDGENSDDSYDEETIDAAEEAHDDHNFTVHTIALSSGADRDLLEEVAQEGGGEFYYAEDAGELSDVFDDIANETQTETVHMIQRNTTQMTARHSTVQSVDISLNDPANSFAGTDGLSLVNDTLVSFELTLQGCEDWQLAGVAENDTTGQTWEHATCATPDPGSSVTVTNTSNYHGEQVLLTDGDSTSALGSIPVDWWHKDPEDILQDEGLTDGSGNVDLPENEAIVAMTAESGSHQGYVLLHFDVPPRTASSGSTEPNVGAGASSPIDLDYSEVIFS